MTLKEIEKKDFEAIYKLTSNKEIMQHILKGLTWDEEKTKRFIDYSLEEQKINDKNRNTYYYTINSKDKIVGVIGFFKDHDLLYKLRIFIDPEYQGQGFFTSSLNTIKEKLLKTKGVDKLYVEVHSDNLKMDQIIKKKYYFNKIFYIGKKKVNQYIIFLRDYTYLVKSEYISEEVIDQLFKKRGNFKKHVSGIYPDYLHLDGTHYYDKNNYKYKVILKNIVDDGKKTLTIKSELAKTIGDKPFFLKTYIFNRDEKIKKIDNNKTWILKPDNGFSGEGILVITSKEYKTVKLNPDKKFNIWSLQEYITNPFLIDGRKFHFRVMFIYIPKFNNDEKMGYWFKKIPIYLAKEKYKNSDYNNLDIHMSHYSDKEPARYFEDLPLDKPNKTKIIIQLKEIMKCLLDNINAECYKKDSKRCYELFGVDLMLDTNIDLKLIEVNSKLGLKEFVNDDYEFNKNLLDAELEITCDRFLPPSNKIENNNLFVKI